MNKHEPQEFLQFVISPQSNLDYQTPPLALMFINIIDTGEPTLMLIKFAKTLYEMSSYVHKRTEDLLMKIITCVLIHTSYNI